MLKDLEEDMDKVLKEIRKVMHNQDENFIKGNIKSNQTEIL